MTWEMCRIADVGEVQLGRQRSPEHHTGPNMRPYLRVANVFDNRIDISDIMSMNFEPAEFERFRLRHGDILLNEGQSRHLVGRPAMFRGEVADACFTNSLVRFRAGPRLLPEFALYLFRHYVYSGEFIRIAKWTTNIAHLGAERFAALWMPVPPLDVQRRIVAKLDALLAQSRAAREQLEAVPDLVEKFRQSVLAAAFRGDLTADWRKKNPNVEPASKLLERIRTERRKAWEAAELAKMKAKGKSPKDDKWKAKYVEPAPVDASDLAELPPTWCWASLDELTLSHDGRRVPVKQAERMGRQGEFPYYGASGVIDHVDDYLFDGDFLLVAEDGANLLSRSTPIAFCAGGRFWVNNHAHVLESVVVHDEYLAAALNATDLQPYVTGSAQPKLTQKNLERLPIALAPSTEQSQVRGHLRLALGGGAVLGVLGPEMGVRMKELERSILAKAFSGELVT